ncbi:MAG: DUF6328 family protein [Acidobacteria bacterium]|nr:DUF6328 family protein [Acidobacteriota bacterium]MCA1617463.1 DUF6328 family protein [Acidobacteriota bacterium]
MIAVANLENRIENALNEARTLILGAQVLLGLQFQAVLEEGFRTLPDGSRYLILGNLGLMVIATALLISPAAYHRIVESGELSDRFHRFTSRLTAAALLPFAIGLGVVFAVVGREVFGGSGGWLTGGLAAGFALFFWYGLELWRRSLTAEGKMAKKGEERKKPGIEERIKNVLTETRVVLPGAQALLGFQFVAVLKEAFEKLPESAKRVHLAGLTAVGIATVFLMAPAAWHRIVEEGRDTERVETVATRFLLAALVFLGIGLSLDLYVVCVSALRSPALGVLASASALVFVFGLWFGYTLFRRARDRGRRN